MLENVVTLTQQTTKEMRLIYKYQFLLYNYTILTVYIKLVVCLVYNNLISIFPKTILYSLVAFIKYPITDLPFIERWVY